MAGVGKDWFSQSFVTHAVTHMYIMNMKKSIQTSATYSQIEQMT